MADAERQRDEAWLSRNWGELGEYEHQWIAVVDAGVRDADRELARLGERIDGRGLEALFAYVTFDPIA